MQLDQVKRDRIISAAVKVFGQSSFKKAAAVVLSVLVMSTGAVVLTPASGQTSDFAAKTYQNSELFGTETLPYRLYVPSNYDSSKRYPLLLFLH
jgi:predicted peptidase